MIEILTQWILGLVTLAVLGIVAMHIKLGILSQRFLDHINHCVEWHEQHRENFKELRAALETLKKK